MLFGNKIDLGCACKAERVSRFVDVPCTFDESQKRGPINAPAGRFFAIAGDSELDRLIVRDDDGNRHLVDVRHPLELDIKKPRVELPYWVDADAGADDLLGSPAGVFGEGNRFARLQVLSFVPTIWRPGRPDLVALESLNIPDNGSGSREFYVMGRRYVTVTVRTPADHSGTADFDVTVTKYRLTGAGEGGDDHVSSDIISESAQAEGTALSIEDDDPWDKIKILVTDNTGGDSSTARISIQASDY